MYSLFLEHNVSIGFQIRHVDLLAVLLNFWMFFGHQPANVAEEKATICIMWIGICVRVLVMLTMITNPHIQAILCREKKNHKTKPFQAIKNNESNTSNRAMNAIAVNFTWPANVCSQSKNILNGVFALNAR